MPTLYPDPLPEKMRKNPRRAGEVQVYDALAAQLPEEWQVYHSVGWVTRGGLGGQDGEADFVIAHPEHGVLVLEVKGGQEIRREPATGKWYSLDGRSEWHKLKHDPFDQAKTSKHVLLAKLQEHPALAKRWLTMAHAVCFPGVRKGALPLGPDAPLVLILDRDDLGRLLGRLEEIFAYHRLEGRHQPLGASGLEAVRRTLAPKARLRLPLGARLAEDEARMVQVSAAQMQILNLLSRTRRAAIHGGAGTGKTLLAVEKARRLAAEGFRTLLTCYNIPLEAHLRAATQGEANITVSRVHRLAHDHATAQGVTVGPLLPDNPDRNYWQRELPEAFDAALMKAPLDFDAVVVDEGQDLDETWWTRLFLCLKDPDGGVFYAFLDPHQNLYGPRTGRLAQLPEFPLQQNMRNTRAIHDFARRFYSGDDQEAGGVDGRAPEVLALEDGQPLAKALAGQLQRLIREEQVPPEDIAILTGRKPKTLGLGSV